MYSTSSTRILPITPGTTLTTVEQHGAVLHNHYGIAIIPTIPGTKHPVVKWEKEYGWQTKPQTVDQFNEMRRRFPRMTFSTACGEGSAFLASVETDCRKGEEHLDKIMHEQHLRPLTETLQGRRGNHRVIQMDGPYRGQNIGSFVDAEGKRHHLIEIKGQGQLLALSGKTLLTPRLVYAAPDEWNALLRNPSKKNEHAQRAAISQLRRFPLKGEIGHPLSQLGRFSPDDLREIPADERVRYIWSHEEVRERYAESVGITYGQCMRCPIHEEWHPSVSFSYAEGGLVWMNDWHERGRRRGITVGEYDVYRRTGIAVHLPRVSQAVLNIRVLVDLGVLEPADIPLARCLPTDVPPYIGTALEGFRFLQACKWAIYPPSGSTYTRRFIQWWTGLSEWRARTAWEYLTEHKYLVQIDVDPEGNPVYIHAQDGH